MDFSWRCSIRGGAETDQLNNLLDLLSLVSLGSHMDKWLWSFDTSSVFSIRSARRLIDEVWLPQRTLNTRWNKFIPIKNNIFLCRVLLDRLLVRSVLAKRGKDLNSTLCPICHGNLETNSHIYYVSLSRCFSNLETSCSLAGC